MGDSQLVHAISEVIGSNIEAIPQYAMLPICKTTSKFPSFRGIESLPTFTESEREELSSHMERLVSMIQVHSVLLLAEAGVASELMLSSAQRVVYDAGMKEFVEREDHYP
ncbi:MAG: hypothetical protein UY04_C0007G0013 [Parcubacteria group bacterium GW2011_GWA2_47_7]|nr:MAG: hypothetical protein UY04_C0007G0013 [Parcubacteria group bacterium GW2011_GWA2_47_7]